MRADLPLPATAKSAPDAPVAKWLVVTLMAYWAVFATVAPVTNASRAAFSAKVRPLLSLR